jgi:hypothetical protein
MYCAITPPTFVVFAAPYAAFTTTSPHAARFGHAAVFCITDTPFTALGHPARRGLLDWPPETNAPANTGRRAPTGRCSSWSGPDLVAQLLAERTRSVAFQWQPARSTLYAAPPSRTPRKSHTAHSPVLSLGRDRSNRAAVASAKDEQQLYGGTQSVLSTTLLLKPGLDLALVR